MRAALHDCGTVFKLTPNSDGSWTESVLHSFNGSDGRESHAGLIFDAAGNLYGTTVAWRRSSDDWAQSSSSPRMPTEAGRKACCIASELPAQASPLPA